MRKLLNSSSFRRKFPCFRKQDSNEWPVLNTNRSRTGSFGSAESALTTIGGQSSGDRTNTSPIAQRKRALSHNIAASLRFAPMSAMAVAGFIPEPGLLGAHRTPYRQSPLRASYHGKTDGMKLLDTGERDRPFSDVVGSAESLVGRVLYEQGLGKYCDPDFVKATQIELREAFNMTQEGLYTHSVYFCDKFLSKILSTCAEMDRAAHAILSRENSSHGDGRSTSKPQSPQHLSSSDDEFKDTKL